MHQRMCICHHEAIAILKGMLYLTARTIDGAIIGKVSFSVLVTYSNYSVSDNTIQNNAILFFIINTPGYNIT